MNGELNISIKVASMLISIGIFGAKFEVLGSRVKKYYISCNNLQTNYTPFKRASSLRLETACYEHRLLYMYITGAKRGEMKLICTICT